MITKPNVFKYLSFSKFLYDYFFYLKAIKQNFSWRVLAKRIGLKSPAFLVMIAKGKRVAKPDLIEQISGAFEWTKEELEYAKLLAVSDGEQRSMGKMQISYQLGKYLPLDDSPEYEPLLEEFAANPITPVIMEMCQIDGIPNDPHVIKKYLRNPYPIAEIQNALKWLIKNNIIYVQNDILRRREEYFGVRHTNPELFFILSKAITKELINGFTNAANYDDFHVGCEIAVDNIEAFRNDLRNFVTHVAHGASTAGGDVVFEIGVQCYDNIN